VKHLHILFFSYFSSAYIKKKIEPPKILRKSAKKNTKTEKVKAQGKRFKREKERE
jgi:hypothetical protein